MFHFVGRMLIACRSTARTIDRLPAQATIGVKDSVTEALPEFAQQWMSQWRRAAVELPRLRDAGLRAMRPAQVTDAMSLLDSPANDAKENPYENGLVVQQRWFMRLRLLQTAGYRAE
jgi:hypothetical protein